MTEDSPWPAVRTPGRLDAEHAYRPLDSSFVGRFKTTLLASPSARDTIDYLNNATECLLDIPSPTSLAVGNYTSMKYIELIRTKLSYPLILLDNFPKVPDDNAAVLLIHSFCNSVYSELRLISFIPIEQLIRADTPKYLKFAMEVLGMMVAGGFEDEASRLWHAANLLITVTLEVDNREARKADLFNAVRWCSRRLTFIDWGP